jgi:nucleoside-diphosphate-sugar epimerase
MLKAIQRGHYFNIGNGKARKSMVLANDVAEFLPNIYSIGGVYNLTDGEHPTVKELSSAIARKEIPNMPIQIAKVLSLLVGIFGVFKVINATTIKKLTLDLTFDDSKAREKGWNPQGVLNYLKYNSL